MGAAAGTPPRLAASPTGGDETQAQPVDRARLLAHDQRMRYCEETLTRLRATGTAAAPEVRACVGRVAPDALTQAPPGAGGAAAP